MVKLGNIDDTVVTRMCLLLRCHNEIYSLNLLLLLNFQNPHLKRYSTNSDKMSNLFFIINFDFKMAKGDLKVSYDDIWHFEDNFVPKFSARVVSCSAWRPTTSDGLLHHTTWIRHCPIISIKLRTHANCTRSSPKQSPNLSLPIPELLNLSVPMGTSVSNLAWPLGSSTFMSQSKL